MEPFPKRRHTIGQALTSDGSNARDHLGLLIRQRLLVFPPVRIEFGSGLGGHAQELGLLIGP
jgi:hypothetical protein